METIENPPVYTEPLGFGERPDSHHDQRMEKMKNSVALTDLLEYRRDKTLAELKARSRTLDSLEDRNAVKTAMKVYAEKTQDFIDVIEEADYHMYIPEAGKDMDRCLEIIADEGKLSSRSSLLSGHDIESLSDSSFKLSAEGEAFAVALAKLSSEDIVKLAVEHRLTFEGMSLESAMKGPKNGAEIFAERLNEEFGPVICRNCREEDGKPAQKTAGFGMGLPKQLPGDLETMRRLKAKRPSSPSPQETSANRLENLRDIVNAGERYLVCGACLQKVFGSDEHQADEAAPNSYQPQL